MNLSKIINSMEKLAEKHRFINNKFNAKGQAPNVFRADIKEDLLNDRKIFGKLILINQDILMNRPLLS